MLKKEPQVKLFLCDFSPCIVLYFPMSLSEEKSYKLDMSVVSTVFLIFLKCGMTF